MKLLSVDRLVDTGDWRPSVRRLDILAGPVAALGLADWHAELAWVEDPEMTLLNRRYRDMDTVTDVLSFSNLVLAGAGPPALGGGLNGASADLWWALGEAPDAGAVGEIVIAPRYVARSCAEKGRDFAAELSLLVVHGALHLLGWDHTTEAEVEAMREVERSALSACGLGHPILDDLGDKSC